MTCTVLTSEDGINEQQVLVEEGVRREADHAKEVWNCSQMSVGEESDRGWRGASGRVDT